MNPTPTQKYPLGPKKVKNDPKIKSNQKSELKKTYKIKVLELQEYTPKHFLIIPQPKEYTIRAPNSQKRPQNLAKFKSQNWRNHRK